MASNVQIKGMKGLERKLNKLSNDVSGPIRDQALEEAGEYFRQDAHDKCPAKGLGSIDGHYPAIGEPSSQSGAVRRSIKTGTPQGGEIAVETNHMLAQDLELGTSREAPHPFMRRAADDPDTRRGVSNKFRNVISKLVEGAVK